MIPKEAARTAYHLRILNCFLRTSEFHKRLELMTMCKNLVIIWVTFPQFCASEIIWPTIDAIFLTWMKGEVFKLAQTVFRSEHILLILGSTASMKPLRVSVWKPIHEKALEGCQTDFSSFMPEPKWTRSERTKGLLVFAASREEPAPTLSEKNTAIAMPCALQWISRDFNNLVKI